LGFDFLLVFYFFIFVYISIFGYFRTFVSSSSLLFIWCPLLLHLFFFFQDQGFFPPNLSGQNVGNRGKSFAPKQNLFGPICTKTNYNVNLFVIFGFTKLRKFATKTMLSQIALCFFFLFLLFFSFDFFFGGLF